MLRPARPTTSITRLILPTSTSWKTPSSDNEEIGFSDAENASLEAAASDYARSAYAYGNEYADDLAEAEAAEFDKAAWCGRYCLAREADLEVAQSLPAGSIRDFVERVSDFRWCSCCSQSCSRLHGASRLAAADARWSRRRSLASGLGLLESSDWSAANRAVAEGANAAGAGGCRCPWRAGNLGLLISPPEPVTLRDLGKDRSSARLAVGVRNSLARQAWSAIGELATEGGEVPEITSRPQSESAQLAQRPGPRHVDLAAAESRAGSRFKPPALGSVTSEERLPAPSIPAIDGRGSSFPRCGSCAELSRTRAGRMAAGVARSRPHDRQNRPNARSPAASCGFFLGIELAG